MTRSPAASTLVLGLLSFACSEGIGSGAPPLGAVPGQGGSAGLSGAEQPTLAGSGGLPAGQVDPLAELEPDPNAVPFECNPALAALGPRRIARLSAREFGPSIEAVYDALNATEPGGLASPFDYVNPADRFSTFTRSYGMNDAEMQSVWEMASYAADNLTEQLLAQEKCLAQAAERAPCVTGLAKSAAEAAFRRPLQAAELAALTAVALDNVEQMGLSEALASMLQVILMSPEFLFRSEIGDPAAVSNGAVPLTPAEQAAAASYAIESGPPDTALLMAASTGSQALAAEVTARLATMANVPTVSTMIREYFRYPGVVNIFKDPELLPDSHRVDLVKDSDTLVAKVLEASGHTELFRALLTAPDVWVSQDTYEWYGITQETATHTKQLRTPPAGQRLGLLTQPSFLVFFSDMDETKPVQRGRFLLETVLCRTVPELPIGVVAKLPDLGPTATQRDRLSTHSSQAGCSGCHQLMDPLGLAFEQYDLYGRFRTEENGSPIQAGGELVGSLDQDGPFGGAVELVQKLASSSGAEQCFVRHSFRYWMGRNERDADGCALVAARDAYRASGGDYAALVAALFSSQSFRERAVEN